MTVHLVTFSSPSMERSMGACRISALQHGVDYDWPWFANTVKHMPEYEKNSSLFDSERGCGYWAWKPLIIKHRMHSLFDGDILIYTDAGVEFISNVSHIIERMDQDIFLFGNNWEHAHWCKRDVVEAVWPFRFLDALPKGHQYIQEKTWERFGKQVQASVIFFRVSEYTRAFVAEWLKWCLFEGGRLIDDSPSRLPNRPEFREHRHDQAILTTLAYRDGLKLHYWPATYNFGAFVYEKLPEYADDDYPTLFHHHRKRDHEWPAEIGARYIGMTLDGERYSV